MAVEAISGWECIPGGHWVEVDGRPCDPAGEPRPTAGLNPWRPSGSPCPACAVEVARFRDLADRRGFDLNPRHRFGR